MDVLQRLLESQLSQANSRVSSMAEDKLQSFKRELSEDNASSLETAFKRLKKDSYTFKNEGNKGQYEHQEKVLESFSQAQACITSSKFEEAAEKIKQGITLVKNRMKLIKLADRSNLVGRPPLNMNRTTWLLTLRMRISVYRNLNVERTAERKLKVKRGKFGLNGPTESFSICL